MSTEKQIHPMTNDIEADDAAIKQDDKMDTLEVTEEAEAIYVSEADSKRIGRRLDRVLMPMICFTYALQSLDKGSLGYGAIWGLQTDLNLTAAQYSLLGSLFYIGYLCLEYPLGYVAQHWHTGRVVGIFCFLWGLTTMSTALTKNFPGIAAARFFLGCFESALTPAFVLITSVFWKRQEQAKRVLIWWSMNGLSGAFGGVISFSAGYIRVGSMQSWKWIFIINGGITVLWAFVLFTFLPSGPLTAKFLKKEDQVLAIHRLSENKTGTRNATIKKYQIIEALDPRKDPQGILLFLGAFFNELPNGGYGNFSSLIIRSLGFTPLQTSLLGIATGMSQVIWMVTAGIVTQRFKNCRIYAAMGALVPSFLGFLLQIALPQTGLSQAVKGAKMFGVCLMPAYAATCALVIQLPAQNAGGFTKRITMTSFAFLGYSLGNIVGPLAFYPGQTPTYLTGFIMSMVCFGCQWCTLATLRFYYVRQNKKRDEMYGEPKAEAGDATTDLTDKENTNFRYVL